MLVTTQDANGSDHESAGERVTTANRKISNSEAGCSSAMKGGWEGLLSDLPMEVLTRVMEYLSAEDLNIINQVCRYLRWSTADDRFWQPLYELR